MKGNTEPTCSAQHSVGNEIASVGHLCCFLVLSLFTYVTRLKNTTNIPLYSIGDSPKYSSQVKSSSINGQSQR